MTGLELAATVRDLSPVTGILLMSANPDGNDVLPHPHLRKPFSAKQLIAAVAAAVGRWGCNEFFTNAFDRSSVSESAPRKQTCERGSVGGPSRLVVGVDQRQRSPRSPIVCASVCR
jgi:hypothetical protein